MKSIGFHNQGVIFPSDMLHKFSYSTYIVYYILVLISIFQYSGFLHFRLVYKGKGPNRGVAIRGVHNRFKSSRQKPWQWRHHKQLIWPSICGLCPPTKAHVIFHTGNTMQRYPSVIRLEKRTDFISRWNKARQLRAHMLKVFLNGDIRGSVH